VKPNKTSPDQDRWLEALGKAAEIWLLYPEEFDAFEERLRPKHMRRAA
jgi:hypothetical protein